MTPRIAYSLMARLGTSDSLSSLAQHAVAALERAGWLSQVLVGSYKAGSAPAAKVQALGLVSRGLRKLAVYERNGWLDFVAAEVYDHWSSWQLRTCDLLHVWGSAGEYALQRAHALGGKVLVERGSSHILTQDRLLREEFAKFGVRWAPIPQFTIRKALREFEMADFILVPSEFAYQSFMEHGFAPEKIILNPFATDVSRFTPGPGDGGKFRAVFVGQVSLRKGAQYVLEAWARLKLPNAELILIGPVMPDMEAIVQPHRADPSIQWVGYTPHLNDYLGRASVFVFPSIEEGSALVTYIAMACGLPLLTTFNAGSVARDGQEGFILPVRDVEALCQRLEQLYHAPPLRQTMGQAARARVEAFSWPAYEERILQVYRRCLNL